MTGKIYGNTSSVRKNLLEYLDGFIGNVYSPGEFLPVEIRDALVLATSSAGIEFAALIDRKNRVEAICAGNSESVNLEGLLDTRRGDKRLSGIRLWHTHPNGASVPSEVDIGSLKSLRLDACGVIGVNTDEERATGISVTLLRRDSEGLLTEYETLGPEPVWHANRFNSVFEELEIIDGEAEDALPEKLEEDAEKAILCGVILPADEKKVTPETALLELKELARTAGAEVVGEFVQRRPSHDPRFYIGKGIAKEISLKAQALSATLLIVDDEISAGTVRNLEDATGLRVIDRTTLILDIFAARARSREGRLQVEMAQQKYRLTRLTGKGIALSRLGGGIGTRGPGESKLTADRNYIKRRISFLDEELKKVSAVRDTLRKERKKNEIPQVAVVGYTNAGKSSLLNALCNGDVLAENMLFATLDPSVRRLVTEDSKDFLIIDTVGFIKKLPHDLVEAFKSTLEELKYADLLLHVVDGSNPDAANQIEVVNEIIKELGAGGKPCYVVVNKVDLLPSTELASDNTGPIDSITYYVSAKTGDGMEKLKEAIVGFFSASERAFSLLIPYSDGKTLSYLHDRGNVDFEEYSANGVAVKGKIDLKYWKNDFSKYEAKDEKN